MTGGHCDPHLKFLSGALVSVRHSTCQFFQIFLEDLSLLKSLFFCPIAMMNDIVFVCVCVCARACVCVRGVCVEF